MGFYDGIENESAATDRSTYSRSGRYLALINRLRSGTSQKDNADYVMMDLTILHVLAGSDIPMMVNPATGNVKDWVPDPKGLHSEGEEIGVFFSGAHQSGRRNYKAFVANSVGVAAESVDAAFCARVEKDGLLNGEVIELNNTMIELKSGAPWTKVFAVRAVPVSEYSKILSEAIVERMFPDGFEALIAAEA